MGMEILNASTSTRRWPRFAALGVMLAAATAAGVMFATHQPNPPTALEGSGRIPVSSPSLPASDPSPSSDPVVEESPSPAPVVIPSPQSSRVAEFQYVCSSSTLSGGTSASTLVRALRVGSHDGYDRLTIEFQGAQPESVKLVTQASSSFTTSPRGDTVRLAGQFGLGVVVTSSDAHTAFTGTSDQRTRFSGLLEVRQLEDFEGHVQYGLGLSRPACYRAYVIANPTRLVVDIQTA
jgi:hypothetical protein